MPVAMALNAILHQAGNVGKLNKPNIKSQYQLNWKVKEGDSTITKASRLGENVGSMLLWNENYEDLREDFNHLKTFIPYTST